MESDKLFWFSLSIQHFKVLFKPRFAVDLWIFGVQAAASSPRFDGEQSKSHCWILDCFDVDEIQRKEKPRYRSWTALMEMRLPRRGFGFRQRQRKEKLQGRK